MRNLEGHNERVRANIAEVNLLLRIHQKLTGSAPGRRRDVQMLNKSAILLLVATWEAYIEDLALEAVRFLVENVSKVDELPERALVRTSLRLEKDKHENSIWRLSGDGWKNELLAQAEIETSKLNTPSPQNVDKLIENILGLRNLSQNWYWKGASRDSTIRRLNKLIEVRGEIAHRMAVNGSVTKTYVEKNVELIKRLVIVSNNRVGTYVSKHVGKMPWKTYRRHSTR